MADFHIPLIFRNITVQIQIFEDEEGSFDDRLIVNPVLHYCL